MNTKISSNIALISEWITANKSATYICKQLNIARDTFKKYYPSYKGISEKRLKLHSDYELNPKRCKHCNNIIDILLRKQTFCSHACSAGYYNPMRGPMSDEQKVKLSLTAKLNRPKSIISQNCINCNVEFASRWGERKTCSDDCFKIISTKNGRIGGINASINGRTSRSKNERYLFYLISVYFRDAISNKRIFDGYDADIIIPSLKTAIHWNGPLHYVPLFGDNLLLKITNRDTLRYKAVKDAGYKNYIIDDSENSGFNKFKVLREFQKFIKQI